MKIWIFITNDSYYGGWFSGAFESKEKAEEALKNSGWVPTTGGDVSYGEWKHQYTYGNVVEYDLNALNYKA